ncbi:MAG: hypothetical protein ACOH1N_09835 [Lutibacter sp.]
MRYFFYTLLLSFFIISCNSEKSKPNLNIDNDFEKSFKKQENRHANEHLDSITNIYSNFKYYVAFDGPNNWKTDSGVSEHTIYRTYQQDSAIAFSINVIEIRKSENDKNEIDIWKLYQENRERMDYPFTTLIEEQLNTKINNFNSKKAYIKNNIALKRKMNYLIKDLDFEYDNTSISYQTIIKNFTYTFTLNLPTIFYNLNPEYYDEIFINIYFLKNRVRLNELIIENNKKQ